MITALGIGKRRQTHIVFHYVFIYSGLAEVFHSSCCAVPNHVKFSSEFFPLNISHFGSGSVWFFIVPASVFVTLTFPSDPWQYL